LKKEIALLQDKVREKEAEHEITKAELRKVQESWSSVNRSLMDKEQELVRERELNLALQDEKHHALYQFECERERLLQLDHECELLM
jgi:hypothetical protein